MPRDYKHRAQKKPERKPLPAWLWLLTGLLLGGFIVGLVWLQGQAGDAGGEWVGARPDRPPQGAPPPAPRIEPPPPRFDFYNMLPKMEVVVPDAQPEPAPKAKAIEQPVVAVPATPAAAAEASSSYLLQVGSFRRGEDADRLKAQLALLGFEAQVSRARINAQDTRYRVRSGPYQGTAALERARKRLDGHGYTAIVIRAGR